MRWGRIAALAVMAMSVVNWAGWATDQEVLIEIVAGWPPMRPWTALWLFLLASAVLLMSAGSGLRWAGRALAAAVALTAAIVLAEYLMGHDFGLDRIWFGQTLAREQNEPAWSGRPIVPVGTSTLLMSGAILMSYTDRRWARQCSAACMAGAMAIPAVFSMVYLLGQITAVQQTRAFAGVAPAAVVGLLLTGSAALLTSGKPAPEWLRSSPKTTTVRVFVIIPLALIAVGIMSRVFEYFTDSTPTAMAFAIALAVLAGEAITASMSRREAELGRAVEAERALLRATSDAALDPQLLLEAVRDADGKVADLIYKSVNRAACHYVGRSEHELLGVRVTEVAGDAVDRGVMGLLVRCLDDGQPVIFDDMEISSSFFPERRVFDVRASKAGADLITVSVRDVTERHRAAARLAESEQHYRLLAENVSDVIARIRNDTFVWVSPSVEHVLGGPPEYWVGRKVSDFVPPEESAAHSLRLDKFAAGGAFQGRIRVASLDGVKHWAHMTANPFFDATGRQDGLVAVLRLIDGEVAAQEATEAALRRAAIAEIRYRHAVEHSAVGMALVNRDGKFEQVNDALCNLLGYPRDILLQKSFKDVTAAEYVDRSGANFADLLAGREESFRETKQYVHADGHRIWGELTVSAIPDDDGEVEYFLAQIIDITALTEANARNRALAHHLQELTEKLGSELGSAAAYMASIMPHGLTGKVDVASTYLPARDLGGDCFDYTWIDDDHLLVYLIDVSGHGLQPALLAVSIHNVLRSGSLSTETLLSPEQTLDTLNRLFRMDHQSDLYFTAWYGVYECSTRTLRYASAGAPPALALTPGTGSPVKPIELSTPCPPVGILADTPFVEDTYCVPADSQVLIYSDGAFELDSDGPPMPLSTFFSMVSRLAASSKWSLDQLVHKLQDRTPTGTFEDDCSLILLTFPSDLSALAEGGGWQI